MEIRSFILNVLDQMQELKSEKSKTNYIVNTIEFELGIIVNDNTRINNTVGIFSLMKIATQGELNNGNEIIHKVKIKLEPKKDRSINNR